MVPIYLIPTMQHFKSSEQPHVENIMPVLQSKKLMFMQFKQLGILWYTMMFLNLTKRFV